MEPYGAHCVGGILIKLLIKLLIAEYHNSVYYSIVNVYMLTIPQVVMCLVQAVLLGLPSSCNTLYSVLITV